MKTEMSNITMIVKHLSRHEMINILKDIAHDDFELIEIIHDAVIAVIDMTDGA